MPAAKKFYTIDDMANLPEKQEAYLWNGELFLMAPSGREHGRVQGKIRGQVEKFEENLYRKPDRKTPGGWIFLTEAWVSYDHSHASFVHDIAGWKIDRYPQEPDTGAIEVPPDWVCEIISPSNYKKDGMLLTQVLREVRVPHYWVVDPKDSEIWVYSATENYQNPRIFNRAMGDDLVIPPFSLPIEFSHVFAKPLAKF